MTKKWLIIFLFGVIFAATCGLYSQTRNSDFINYDDNTNVYACAVTNGLNISSAKWALVDTARATGSWQPLTFLSLMADVSLFGVSPGAMHLHNAVLHTINAVLVFCFLLLLLGCMGNQSTSCENEKYIVDSEKSFSIFNCSLITYLAAFIGAAFWAWHPLRVESVAWITSRKDVLSLFWYLLGHILYLRMICASSSDMSNNLAKRNNLPYLLLPLLAYLLAFISKSTAIVFPCTLVLMEYAVTRRVYWKRYRVYCFIIPLFALLTYFSQFAGGALAREVSFTFAVRLENAFVALNHYMWKTIYPVNLSCINPIITPLPVEQIIFGILWATLFLCVIVVLMRSIIFSFIHSNMKFLNSLLYGYVSLCDTSRLTILGILWFFGCLMPVLGLISIIGSQSSADRFTYLPALGLSIMISALVVSLGKKEKREYNSPKFERAKYLFLAVAFGALVALATTSYGYIKQWKDANTLWDYILCHSPDNYVALCNKSFLCSEKGDDVKALDLMCRAVANSGGGDVFILHCEALFCKMENIKRGDNPLLVEIRSDDPSAKWKHFVLGFVGSKMKVFTSAEMNFRRAIELDKADFASWPPLGFLLLGQETRQMEALDAFEQALARKPGNLRLAYYVRECKKRIKP